MNSNGTLNGLTGLVTGATSGIGRSIAEELGRQGAEVIVHGRYRARGFDVVEAIAGSGATARFAAADLNDPPQVDELIRLAGRVDVLVNNAGVSWFGPSDSLDVDTFDRLFAANVRAAYFLTAALAPRMAERGSGCVINMSSMAGQIGLVGGAVYGATKAAVAALTRSGQPSSALGECG